MTLKQLIKSVDLHAVYRYIFDKDKRLYPHEEKIELKKCGNAYARVITALLDKPDQDHGMPILVRMEKQWEGEEEYINVGLINPNFEPPPEGALPWGGSDCPPGYYDCNQEKHSKYFAFGMGDWGKYVNSDVINEVIGLKDHELLGEILWELTFYGFSEQKQNEMLETLKERVAEIDSGKVKLIPWEEAKKDLLKRTKNGKKKLPKKRKSKK